MNTHLPFLLPFLLFVANDVGAQPCQNIGAVDFRNGVIETQLAPEVLDGPLRFRNGVFDETLEPGGAVEWHFRISKDLSVHPDRHTTIRFIQISGDHLSGTGTRNYVLGFRCADGHVKNVFSEAGEGLMLVSATSDVVQLSTPVWKSSDPHCCPSEEKKTWFSWNKVSGGYVENNPRNTAAPNLR